jgi:UrcA family protein
MKTLINTAAAIALSATTALGMTGAAHAASDSSEVTVSFADLNLASETGTQIFDRRIARAVEQVCGGQAPRELGGRVLYKRCIAQAEVAVKPHRDLAVASYRNGTLAQGDRIIRFAVR